MYIRFITEFKNEDGENTTGVFQALGYLLRTEHALDYDMSYLKELRAWFNTNLEKPTRFSKSKRDNADTVALSWFKSSAHDHIERMFELKAVLERYDMVVGIVKREKPGYIIYEDEYQVTTLPFRTDREEVK